jgi:hypothetical protein
MVVAHTVYPGSVISPILREGRESFTITITISKIKIWSALLLLRFLVLGMPRTYVRCTHPLQSVFQPMVLSYKGVLGILQ